MDRKDAKEQNDISGIIGNLPKRLQKKIAEETGADYNVGVFSKASDLQLENVAVVKDTVLCQSDSSEVANIDMFLKMTSKSRETAYLDDETPVRGILRIQKIEKQLVSAQAPAEKRDIQTIINQKNHPNWFEYIFVKDLVYAKPLPLLHDFVTDLLERKVVVQNWDTFKGFRKQLQEIFVQLLTSQLKFCCEQNVEAYFWKLLYYNVIEYFKSSHNQNHEPNEWKSIVIINDGHHFYTALLQNLTHKYLSNNSNEEPTHKYEFLAKVSAQKLLICLGDLCRYKAKFLNTNDYKEAWQFYQQAQSLIPSNGIPYNQLAILAIYSRKKLDAIYYHMRSLMSSNAIQSARESLKVLFDEIRKKYEESNKSPLFGTPERKIETEPKSLRKEVWIYPDGLRQLYKTDFMHKNKGIEEKRLCDLPADEILKQFTSTYLYIVGKLFSGIGFENFQENVQKILAQLSAILNRPPPLILTRHRLLKIAALNIFVITHNKSNVSRREIFNHAFNVANQVFGIISKSAKKMLIENKSLSSNCVAEIDVRDVNTLLQYVKIWCDWLSINTDIWISFLYARQEDLNPWIEFEELLSILAELKMDKSCCSNTWKTIPLEEDIFLKGFTPLPSNDYQKCDKGINAKESENFLARTSKILEFGRAFLQHHSNLGTISIPTDTKQKLGHQEVSTLQEGDENDNSVNIIPTDEQSKSDVGTKDMADILQLSKLKRELEVKTNITKKYNEKLEEILKFVDTKLYIEVRPKYLLPDTNCFIDYLDDFDALIKKYKRYTLVVPLTVVKELDGLSKGAKIESYENKHVKKSRIHHFDDVSTRAKKSLDFIKSINNNVKCATIMGSIINASLFGLVEEQQASNDDKILATALALSKSMSSEASKDGKTFIQTELVLITTDRNLRVKALARKLAVSELKEFLQWANNSVEKE